MGSTFDGNSGDLGAKICGSVVASILAVVVIGCALRLADELRPRTGDIISFDPAKYAANADRSPMVVVKVGGSPASFCTLEPSIMRASGGSLVIDFTQLEPALSYHAHWAGPRTSDDAEDCGTSAELLLSPADISALALAAGGWQ